MLRGNGGVDSARINFEPMLLVGWQHSECAFGRRIELERALQPIRIEHRPAKDCCKLAGGVATQHVHLPQAVLSRDESLGKDHVVAGASMDVRHATRVASHSHWRRKTVHDQLAVEFWQIDAHGRADEVASEKERSGGQDDQEYSDDSDDFYCAASVRTGDYIRL